MLTVSEWAAKTEVVKGQIAEQKYIQATRQLSREQKRIRLEDIADAALGIDIERASVGLESKKLGLQADKIALRGERDRVRYLEAKNVISQRLMAVELQQLEVNLSSSQRKLDELRNVAKTLDHKITPVLPKNLFTQGD